MVVGNMALLRQLLMLLLLSGANSLYYEDGFDHYYSYSSESDFLGLHNVTTVMKFRIRPINSTAEGSLNMIMVDSFVQYSAKGYFADNPLKWDLSKEFLFFVTNDGLVVMVHHHPEDEHEVLSLKKVLASTLSVKVMVKNVGKWEFSTREEDHAGTFDHEYTGERTSTGLKFHRTHSRSTNVLRFHNKTVHLDRSGTPLEVECVDNVTLHHGVNTIKRKPMEGEEEIIDEQSGEFPRISSVSKTKLKLEAKRLHGEERYYPSNNLTRDNLLIKHKEPAKVSLDSVETEVRQNLNCIRRYENKFEANRTECVNNLRKLFMSVHDEDFLTLASKVLVKQCDVNDTMCRDERSLFIDLVGGHGSPGAQRVFLDLVILQPNVSEEDMSRFLFHCIPLKNPIPEVVSLVEELCHGQIEHVDGVISMKTTGRRACLSLGALAKNLHETNVTVSDRLVERLEKWLEPHNETKTADFIKPRQRRSISQMARSQRKHIETKMVLLQSLGNAAKKRSLEHIKSYLEPNQGHTVWRRAAANSLRHFTCDESLSALLKTAVHDKDDVVRQTAQKVLNKHPKSGNITREQENIVLSKNYTYQVVSRVKRGAKEILDVLMKGFEFRFEAPGIEWDKTIGSKDIGASMGLTIRNLIDLKLSLMEGHFLVDCYDGAFAEAHVAVLDFQVDIVKAFVCFKGHINYNLNLLKDFGINDAQDLLNIYDKVMDRIVNPIKAVIDGFRDIIQMFRDGTMTEVFNSFRDTVRNLPKMLGALTLRVRDFLKDLYGAANGVVTEELKNMIGHIRHYIDGIKSDCLGFYTSISSAVTALPYLGKKVKEAFNLIIDAFKAIVDAPVQGFTAMTRATTHIKTAVAMLLELKDKIMETAGMVKGKVSMWMKVGKVVPRMLRKLETSYDRLYNSKPWLFSNDSTSEYTDGVATMKNSFRQVREDFLKKWDLVMVPMRELQESAKPFLDQFKKLKTLMQGIKWAYKGLKDAISIGKALVQKVFGPKFHPKFLTLRTKGDDKCPPGMYPTTTNDHYQTIGVDLAFGTGMTVPCPVDSMVYVKDGNRLILKPTETEFSSMEIVIDNVEKLEEGVGNGERCKAGQDVGKTVKTGICKDSFIHLAIRQRHNETLPDADYKYIDPSMFLDKFSPISKWIQECMDYEFRFIGQSFDTGEADGDEPMSKINKLKRSFMDLIGSKDDLDKEMDEKKIDEDKQEKRRSVSDMIGGLGGAIGTQDGPGLGVEYDEDYRDKTKENAENFKTFYDNSFFGERPSVKRRIGFSENPSMREQTCGGNQCPDSMGALPEWGTTWAVCS